MQVIAWYNGLCDLATKTAQLLNLQKSKEWQAGQEKEFGAQFHQRFTYSADPKSVKRY